MLGTGVRRAVRRASGLVAPGEGSLRPRCRASPHFPPLAGERHRPAEIDRVRSHSSSCGPGAIRGPEPILSAGQRGRLRAYDSTQGMHWAPPRDCSGCRRATRRPEPSAIPGSPRVERSGHRQRCSPPCRRWCSAPRWRAGEERRARHERLPERRRRPHRNVWCQRSGPRFRSCRDPAPGQLRGTIRRSRMASRSPRRVVLPAYLSGLPR